MAHALRFAALATFLWLAPPLAPEAPAQAVTPVPTYSAVYDVTYKGRRAGTSEFSVTADADSGHYTFTSSTQARGILRLLRPNPAVDRSVFEIEGGRVRSLEFWYEDGSRKGEDNFHIVFDWSAMQARVESEDGLRTFDLEPGTTDRGSVQVAIMLAMNAGRDVGPYTLIDDDGPETYTYEPQEPAAAETGQGSVPTERILQQRAGSSRSTLLWLAPTFEHLPVRIEQIRDGAPETVFLLESVSGLGE